MRENEQKSLCEVRPGIGLCDECGKPNHPQDHVRSGCMVCLDCLNKAVAAETEAKREKRFPELCDRITTRMERDKALAALTFLLGQLDVQLGLRGVVDKADATRMLRDAIEFGEGLLNP